MTSDEAIASFDTVCGRDDTYCELCRVPPLSISANSTLLTVVTSYTFHDYILRPPTTVTKGILPLEPTSLDDADEISYRNALERITRTVNWYDERGTLGRPAPNRKPVWFTDLTDLEMQMRANASGANVATRVRDALGLIHIRGNSYLLALEFLAGNVQTISGLKMARPGFADRGGRRFAAYLDDVAANWYSNDWGIAVHLGKLASLPAREISGAPERVCNSIPLSQIGKWLVIRPLGWVVGNRGEVNGVDDDKAFVGRLMGRGRTLANIIADVVRIANRP